MWSRKLLYVLLVAFGAISGGTLGLAASMWGGIEIILPFCVVVGGSLGYSAAYLIDLFTR
jgi:hypothetical protein